MRFARDAKHRSANQEKKLKNCAFPNCGDEFWGLGKTKYCAEHQLSKYRSELYGRKPGETAVFDCNGDWVPAKELNITLKHSYTTATSIERKCSLDGCDCTYKIMLLPNQYIYGAFCKDHSNEYKRNRFIQQQKLNNPVEPEES